MTQGSAGEGRQPKGPPRGPRRSQSSATVTVAEVVAITGLAAKTIRREINAGRLPAERNGVRGDYRIQRTDLRAWQEARRRRQGGDAEGVDSDDIRAATFAPFLLPLVQAASAFASSLFDFAIVGNAAVVLPIALLLFDLLRRGD